MSRRSDEKDSRPPGSPPTEAGGGEDEVTRDDIFHALVNGSDEARLDAPLVAAQIIERLGIADFLALHRDRIFSKLEDCERLAGAADSGGDLMFVALSLPIMNGLIIVASSKQRILAAGRYINSFFRRSGVSAELDEMAILSALALIYVVNMGHIAFKRDKELRDNVGGRRTWARMRKRLQRLY